MTAKLFISIPQKDTERGRGQREREREGRRDGARRERTKLERYGMDTRGEKACGQNALRTKRRKESTVQQDEKTHRKWIVLSTDGQMRTERVTHQEEGVSKGSFQRSASDRSVNAILRDREREREREREII